MNKIPTINYVIKVGSDHDCFIDGTKGDPGRSRNLKYAKAFQYIDGNKELKRLRRKYPNRDFELVKLYDLK
jgi:hypothetical protein